MEEEWRSIAPTRRTHVDEHMGPIDEELHSGGRKRSIFVVRMMSVDASAVVGVSDYGE
jgi:hypothetical protein